MSVPINNVPRRVVYAASGTGPYNFSFEILAATDIAVYLDDSLITLTTDYTVVINANGTGAVTLTATPTGYTQIAIVGNRTIQRLTDFVTGGDFFANTLNNELDQQTIFAQQNAEGLGRALSAPQTDPTSIDMTLPSRLQRANQYLVFDADGNPNVSNFNKTGSGLAVFNIGPTLIAPVLGTPASGNLGNCTNVNLISGITGILPIAHGGTSLTAFGTGVQGAMQVNVGSAGSFVLNGGVLGTPSSGTLSSCTGLPVSTGISGLGTGVATFLATPSSANLRTAVTDKTGSGSLVFATSPTLVTPTIGVATATSINSLVLNRGTGTGNAESVAVGGTALDSATNGEKNTAVGYAAGTQATSGKESVFIGWTAGKSFTTGEKSIYIGVDSEANAGGSEKEIVIGAALKGKGNDTAFIGGTSGAYNEANTTTWATTSDQRLKKNIADNDDGLAKIQAIRVRNFEYRTPDEITDLPPSSAITKPGVQLGIIAQEMLPECVREMSNGVLSVDTDRLVWYLVNAVKQLATRIEELEGGK
jgi:hypothetical protein